MTDILESDMEKYTVEEPMYGGMPDQGLPYSKASLWIKHQLGDMNYHSAIMLAHEALADIADKIERNEITDDKRKPVADVIRYVSRLMIQRYDPVD